MRLFETLVKAHGEALLVFLPRIVGAIIRRFKDVDTVAEACVDTLTTLAEHTGSWKPTTAGKAFPYKKLNLLVTYAHPIPQVLTSVVQMLW